MLCIQDKERYTIELDDVGGKPTVKQLAEHIANITKIPVPNQRLICKGESLSAFYAVVVFLFNYFLLVKHVLMVGSVFVSQLQKFYSF